jgi:hypothetical protein
VEQVRSEAARHEQRRAQAAARLASPQHAADPGAMADAYEKLATVTRRAAVMEAQVEVLEGKRKALARHRDAMRELASALAIAEEPDATTGSIPAPAARGSSPGAAGGQPLSRVVLSAQEDLRREIARAMHDGPAQALTNIVLQAQIVERLLSRDTERAGAELKLLVSMVQHTLEATKRFIFDVRPMVLDDLGLVPTLRRSARERGRQAQVPVAFELTGSDRRLSMELESAVFRMVDEALAAYLGLHPDEATLHLDWNPDVLEVRLTVTRRTADTGDALPDAPADDVPAALRAMMEEQRSAQAARIEAVRTAAIPALPQSVRREILERAASVGVTTEILAEGTELRLTVPLPPEPAGR